MADLFLSGKVALGLVLLSVVIIYAFFQLVDYIFILKKIKSSQLKAQGMKKMEHDAYKRFDPFQYFHSFFLLGLAVALGFCLVAFNWAVPRGSSGNYDYEIETIVDTEIIPRRTSQQEKLPKQTREIAEDVVALKKDLLIKKPKLVETKIEVDQNSFTDSEERSSNILGPRAKKIPLFMPPEREDESIDKVVFVAEQMPRFPGCEDVMDEEERKQCAQKAMLEYIYSKLKYPKFAQTNNIEGVTIIQFVIDKTGKIINPKIVRDTGGGCGAAALDVVNSMNDMEEAWIPGKQNGRPVKVLFTLPIKFELH